MVAAAQMGPVPLSEKKEETVGRLIGMLVEAAARGARLVVFPEAALTPFFPHWLIDDEAELDSYYETAMPSPVVAPLFEMARELRVGFYLGFAELTPDGRRFNTSILVSEQGEIIGKYRKIHLPGYATPRPHEPVQNLEKRYFEVGDLGFPVWDGFGGRVGMCICNDRRWPETYRVMGLQGVELVMVGYNSLLNVPAMAEVDHLQSFHNHLSMQSNAYFNGTWVVASARAGVEEGIPQLGQSVIIAPSGEITAQAYTNGDEVIVGSIDLDACNIFKRYMFNFRQHRRPEHYGLISAPVEQSWDSGPLLGD
nr:N-carbamoyl-D-amino-acid hydrolase [Streptomyces sp. SID10853]